MYEQAIYLSCSFNLSSFILFYQVKFIDRDPHRYTRRVKEAIQIRLHSNNINRDNGIEIPEAWMPTIRKHNSCSTTKQTREGTSSANRNNKDRNTPITANQRAKIAARKQSTSSPDEDAVLQSKRRDQYLKAILS